MTGSIPRSLLLLAIMSFGLASTARSQDKLFDARVRPFLDAHCVECHGPEVHKAGLRLDGLKLDFRDPRSAEQWIRIHDKIATGEMPPKKRERPPQRDLDAVKTWLRTELAAASRSKQQKEGRVVLRRLNGVEYRNTLRDLLGVDIDVVSLLPEDNSTAGFDNISSALDISATHLLAYQEAADKAIAGTVPYRPPGTEIIQRTGEGEQRVPRQDMPLRRRRARDARGPSGLLCLPHSARPATGALQIHDVRLRDQHRRQGAADRTHRPAPIRTRSRA